MPTSRTMRTPTPSLRAGCAAMTAARSLTALSVSFWPRSQRPVTIANVAACSSNSWHVSAGWGHTTAPMRLATKLADSRDHAYALPWTRKAITDAYARAGIAGPDDLDAIETHDCFTMSGVCGHRALRYRTAGPGLARHREWRAGIYRPVASERIRRSHGPRPSGPARRVCVCCWMPAGR